MFVRIRSHVAKSWVRSRIKGVPGIPARVNRKSPFSDRSARENANDGSRSQRTLSTENDCDPVVAPTTEILKKLFTRERSAQGLDSARDLIGTESSCHAPSKSD